MQLFVVPRSIPSTFAMSLAPEFAICNLQFPIQRPGFGPIGNWKWEIGNHPSPTITIAGRITLSPSV
jgi:hypothetical protein